MGPVAACTPTLLVGRCQLLPTCSPSHSMPGRLAEGPASWAKAFPCCSSAQALACLTCNQDTNLSGAGLHGCRVACWSRMAHHLHHLRARQMQGGLASAVTTCQDCHHTGCATMPKMVCCGQWTPAASLKLSSCMQSRPHTPLLNVEDRRGYAQLTGRGCSWQLLAPTWLAEGCEAALERSMAAAVSLNRGGVQPAGGMLPAGPAGSRASAEGPAPRCTSRSAQQTALPHAVCSLCSGAVHLGQGGASSDFMQA